MFAVAKIDYSRFREIRVGHLLADDRLDLPRPAVRRGRARLPPLDRAPLLPLPALGARQAPAHRRPRGVRDRAHPPRHARCARRSRILALGLAPAALVFLQPDLGTGIVLRGHHTHHSFPRRGALDALRGDRRPGGARRQLRPGHRPGRRPAEPAARLSAGPADCIPASQQRPERCELSGQPERHRDRLRREDRTRRQLDPDRAPLPPRAAHGLRLRRDRGALRLRWEPHSYCPSTPCLSGECCAS